MARTTTSTPAPAVAALDDLALNIAAFSRHLDAERKAKKTIRIYGDAARDLERFLRAQAMPVAVANITGEHIREYFRSLRDRLSPATQNQTYRSLQAFWKYLIAEGEVKDSPMKNIARPTIPETIPRLVTIDEMQALLRACEGREFADRRDAAILSLFYSSGVRLAEMAGIQQDDMRLDHKEVLVTGKFTRQRYVRFGATTARSIDRYIRVRQLHSRADSPAFWIGERGALTVWGITQMIERRATQAGLTGVHAHAFRHAFANGYLLAGGQEGDLMHLAGWKSRAMVEVYARGQQAERARRNYDPFDPMERLRRS